MAPTDTPDSLTNGAHDEAPDPIDVFHHAMLDGFTEDLYNSRKIIQIYDPVQDTMVEPSWGNLTLVHQRIEDTEHPPQRCFVGNAAIVALREGKEVFLEYQGIAEAHGVPTELVTCIGDGVIGMTFENGVAFVNKAIAAYKEFGVPGLIDLYNLRYGIATSGALFPSMSVG